MILPLTYKRTWREGETLCPRGEQRRALKVEWEGVTWCVGRNNADRKADACFYRSVQYISAEITEHLQPHPKQEAQYTSWYIVLRALTDLAVTFIQSDFQELSRHLFMSVSCKSNLATLAWSTIWATGSIWTVGATTLVSKYNIILKVTRQQKNIVVYFYCCSKLTWLFFSMEQKECWGITASVTIHFVLNKGAMEVNGDWGCQSLTSAICVPCKNNIGKSYGFKPALCLTFRFSLEKCSQLTIMSKTLWIHIFFFIQILNSEDMVRVTYRCGYPNSHKSHRLN